MAIAGAGVLDSAETQDSAATLAIGLGGGSRSLDVQQDRIIVLARRHAGPGRLRSFAAPAATAVPPTAAAEPYAMLRDFPATTAGDALCTVSLLPNDVGGYIEAAVAVCAQQRVHPRLVVEPTVARLHVVLQSNGPEPDEDALGTAVVRMRALATSRRGHLVLRRASRGVKERAGVWGNLGPAGFLMQRLRHTFDPRGTLARGRFVEAG
jgi:hypothetical protein